MKVYQAFRTESIDIPNGGIETDFYRGFCVVTVDGKPLESVYPVNIFENPLQHFEWGYKGVLPTNLAFSVLYDFFDVPYDYIPNQMMWEIIREFRDNVLANKPLDTWEIKESDIEEIAKRIASKSEYNQ